MNSKITLPKMAALMAESTGRTKRQCEDFLREFFNLITLRLSEGESVKIKGLGTFRLSKVEPRKSVDVASGRDIEIPGHVKVVFMPSKDMAEAVNAPFEMFQAVELSDEVSDEELENPDIDLDSEDVEVENIVEENAEENLEENLEVVEYSTEFVNEPLDNPEPEKVAQGESEPVEEVPEKEEPEVVETSEEGEETEEIEEIKEESTPASEEVQPEMVEKKGNSKFGKGFLLGFACCLAILAIGFGIAYAVIMHKVEQMLDYKAVAVEKVEAVPVETVAVKKTADVDTVAKAQSESKKAAESVATQQSDAVVYDVINETRYLTTVAKEHYGNFHLWPYIYEENKAILGNPNRIRPGTRIVVPDLKKYGVDPKNPADIKEAKKKAAEIYSRYQ